MRELSLGLMPGPIGVRVLLEEAPGRTLLKAVLPEGPKDPRAPGLLCEALALWCGTRVRAALCAADPDVFSDTSPWLEAVGDGEHHELRLVVGHDAPDDDEELGEFDDVRAFVRRWIAP